MAIPQEILDMNEAAHLCGTFDHQFPNPNRDEGSRAVVKLRFHVYLEVVMQSKHDWVLRGYCQKIKAVCREEKGTQVPHPKDATVEDVLGEFYAQRASMAADVVENQMRDRWEKAQKQGDSVFPPGVQVNAAVQRHVQEDDYQYEISYWYEKPDVYVLFHCYPSR